MVSMSVTTAPIVKPRPGTTQSAKQRTISTVAVHQKDPERTICVLLVVQFVQLALLLVVVLQCGGMTRMAEVVLRVLFLALVVARLGEFRNESSAGRLRGSLSVADERRDIARAHAQELESVQVPQAHPAYGCEPAVESSSRSSQHSAAPFAPFACGTTGWSLSRARSQSDRRAREQWRVRSESARGQVV